jgi:WD40-like Beta Propeller Repeat
MRDSHGRFGFVSVPDVGQTAVRRQSLHHIFPGRICLITHHPADFTKATLAWVDRNGHSEPLTSEERDYWQPALSPDGQRLVVRIGADLWLYELQRSTLSRFTFAGFNAYPVWTVDGSAVVYTSNRDGDLDLYLQPASGSAAAKRLLHRESTQMPCSVLKDGTVAFVDVQAETGRDLWTMSPDGKIAPFLVKPFNETACRFSPDGRCLAYSSDESGRREIYVQPFPGPGEKIAVFTNGGNYPVWSRNGRELFYRQGDAMMVVEVSTAGVFSATREHQLFTSQDPGFRGEFDVSADGKRFLTNGAPRTRLLAVTARCGLKLFARPSWRKERPLAPGICGNRSWPIRSLRSCLKYHLRRIVAQRRPVKISIHVLDSKPAPSQQMFHLVPEEITQCPCHD